METEDLLTLASRYVSLAQAQEVDVVFDPNVKVASADLESRRRVLLNRDVIEEHKRDPEFLSALLGLCLQEGGHNRYTPNQWPTLVQALSKHMGIDVSAGAMAAGWAEEARVDSKVSEDLPGFREHLHAAKRFRATPLDEEFESLKKGGGSDIASIAAAIAANMDRVDELPESCSEYVEAIRTILALSSEEDVLRRVIGSLTAVKKFFTRPPAGASTERSDSLTKAMQEPDPDTPQDPGEPEEGDGESHGEIPADLGLAKPGESESSGGGRSPYEIIPQHELNTHIKSSTANDRSVLSEHIQHARKLRRMLRFRNLPSRRSVTEYGLRSGDLDEDVLAMVPAGYQDAFEITEEYLVKHDDIDLAVLLDESGSMSSGSRWPVSKGVLACLQYATSQLRSVRLRVYGFTADLSGGYLGSHGAACTVYLHYDSGRGVRGPYLASTNPKRENRDGDAIRAVREDLADSDRQKAIIMISDGNPCASGYGSSGAEAHVSKEVEKATGDGVLFHHLQIGGVTKSSLTRMYGKQWSKVDSVSEVPDQITALVREWLG